MSTPQQESGERKRAEFSGGASQKKQFTPILLVVLVAVVAIGIYLVVAGSNDKPQATAVLSTARQADTAASPEIRIPIADLANGKAKFFDYTLSSKTPVRFFAVKSKDGLCRVAMDACEVCFHAKKGYQ